MASKVSTKRNANRKSIGQSLLDEAHADLEDAQSSGDAQQLRRAGDLPSNLAQMHRAALVDPYNQPDEVAHLRNSLTSSQFTNLLHPSMIELVDRHWVAPFRKMVTQNQFYWRSRADQLFLC